jgi:flagellar secretion chaperone FliS
VSIVSEYLETQVLTASPHRLHLLVVDGALRFAQQALMALEDQNWEAFERALSRSRDCVTELLGGLRDDAGVEVVDSLKALFAYVFRCLAYADPQRDAQLIRDAIRVLELHRETWLELGEKLAATNSGETSVPSPHAFSFMA